MIEAAAELEKASSDPLFAAARARQQEGWARRWMRLWPTYFCYFAYTAFHAILWPILGLRSLHRAQKRGYRDIIRKRLFGGTKPPHEGRWTIIYAGGIGEARAAFAVAEALQNRGVENVAVALQSKVASQIKHATVHSAVMPFNNPISVAIFLYRWRPKAILGTEFWDNLHLAGLSSLLGIKTLLYNVPITEIALRSITWRNRWKHALVGAYCCQARDHAERAILGAGVDPEVVVLTGPVGIDVPKGQGLDETPEEIVARYRREFHVDQDRFPVIVCGSTYDDEEEMLLQAFERVRAEFPKAILIIAPRNRTRQGGPTSILDRCGVDYVRRTEGWERLKESGVILLDSIGELKHVYSIGHIAFVGGTYDPVRTGHTPVEAMAWGLPVTIGPYHPQQKVIVDMIVEAKCAKICRDLDELTAAWLEYARSDGERGRIARTLGTMLADSSIMIWRIYSNLCT